MDRCMVTGRQEMGLGDGSDFPADQESVSTFWETVEWAQVC